MQVAWSFNANQYEPNQGFGIHPPALKIPFTISNTSIKETKDKTGGYLSVEFTTPQGVINNNYNINNASPKAVEIAYGQLSALCRAIGVYQIDGNNECAALRGGKGLMDINYQTGEEPGPNNPNAKGYTEVKRVYDMGGNEPGKTAQAQAQSQQNQPQGQQPAPMTAQPGGGWGNQPQAQQAPLPSGQAWQPGGTAPATAPPWGQR